MKFVDKSKQNDGRDDERGSADADGLQLDLTRRGPGWVCGAFDPPGRKNVWPLESGPRFPSARLTGTTNDLLDHYKFLLMKPHIFVELGESRGHEATALDDIDCPWR